MARAGSDNTFTEQQKLQLVEGCKTSNRQSQKELFHLYKSSVYSIISHYFGASIDKDDIIQQAFISIFRSLESFKGLSSLDTWVYRITVKVCIDYMRKKYRKRVVSLTSDSEHIDLYPDTSRDNTQHTFDDKELKRHVYDGLDKLNREKRMALILFELEGFSLEEIAQIMHKPVGTIKSRLFHGRKELALHLKHYIQ